MMGEDQVWIVRVLYAEVDMFWDIRDVAQATVAVLYGKRSVRCSLFHRDSSLRLVVEMGGESSGMSHRGVVGNLLREEIKLIYM
jgi:hypothetical protein